MKRIALAGIILASAGVCPLPGGQVHVGIYGLTAAGDFQKASRIARGAGFGMAVVNAKRSQLDVLQANGLRAIVAFWLSREAARDEASWVEELNRVREGIVEVRGHPALFAYYLTDEPDGSGIPVEKAKEACGIARSLDERTPLLAVFNDPGRWSPYLALFDIVAVDPYLRRGSNGDYASVSVVSEWLDGLRADLRRAGLNRRVWVVLGAFDLRPKNGAASRYRKPTPEEFRTMYMLARRRAVDGVLLYTYAFGATDQRHGWILPTDDPLLWTAVRDAIHGLE